jgi:hypothetical protein
LHGQPHTPPTTLGPHAIQPLRWPAHGRTRAPINSHQPYRVCCALAQELCQEELSRQLANPGRKLSQEFLAQRQRHDKREYKQRMKRTGS